MQNSELILDVMPYNPSFVPNILYCFTTSHIDNCVHTHTSFNDNQSSDSQVDTVKVKKMLEETLLSTEEN